MRFEQRLETGPWFEVSQRIDGAAAQVCLIDAHTAVETRERPYCVYVHVPFCASICNFCALYTHAVSAGQDAVFDSFTDHVIQHIKSDPNTQRSQAPTTVHFGGGTPLHLGLERLGLLAGALREDFGDSAQCEWAIETTTSSMDLETMQTLSDFGFSRIHLGIQTLDDPIRKRIGRRETGDKAIEKIGRLLNRGVSVSVDLIIGFAHSNESILRRDLERLYDAGIRMFSVCALRDRFVMEPPVREQEEKSNYACWAALWSFMEDYDLRPIHAGQFAERYEDNLYFTHPVREEDCVAIGPYAHGSCGNLSYGNKLLPDYYRALDSLESPIDFAVVYDDSIQALRGLERELLAHRILPDTVANIMSVYGGNFDRLWDAWIRNGLILQSTSLKAFVPSMSGSWYIGNMIGQLRELGNKHGQPELFRCGRN